MEEKKMTHFDEKGNAIMVDVSEKPVTARTAVAEGSIFVNQKVLEAVTNRSVKKGDVLTVAQIAGIMGAKQTSALIPMCHNLLIEKCGVEFQIDREASKITAKCLVRTQGKTGAEMEALTGVQIALLTIYDMCKAIDKRMCISQVHLVEKTGGKSGEFHWDEKKEEKYEKSRDPYRQ